MHHIHSYIPYGINDISFTNMLDNNKTIYARKYNITCSSNIWI